MKGVLTSSILFAALWPLAQAQEQRVQKSGCTACHSVDARVVGPAFHDVAQRYKDRPDAVAYLATKIREGGVGVWGQIPMPAQPMVSDDEARALAAWVLGR